MNGTTSNLDTFEPNLPIDEFVKCHTFSLLKVPKSELSNSPTRLAAGLGLESTLLAQLQDTPQKLVPPSPLRSSAAYMLRLIFNVRNRYRTVLMNVQQPEHFLRQKNIR